MTDISGTIYYSTAYGSLEIEDEIILADPDFQLTLVDEVIEQAPTSVDLAMAGGLPERDVTFSVDGTDVWTTQTDSSGALTQASLNITADLGGAAGAHAITAQQESLDGSTVLAASAEYVVLNDPESLPADLGDDEPPIELAAAIPSQKHLVRRWVLQDLVPPAKGGIGSYVFPINPKEMTSPHYEHTLTSKHTTAVRTGRFHVFQAGATVKEWSFNGYCPTEEMAEKLLQYRDLNRRLYVIDHHGRAWKVIITHVEIKPRLQHIFNGEVTDWGSDYTVTTTLVDQEWVKPT